MKYGLRELKNGHLSQAVRSAAAGEEVVITDRGRPVARIVSFDTTRIPESIQQLSSAGGITIRQPSLESITPIPMTRGRKSAVDYVRQQRR